MNKFVIGEIKQTSIYSVQIPNALSYVWNTRYTLRFRYLITQFCYKPLKLTGFDTVDRILSDLYYGYNST